MMKKLYAFNDQLSRILAKLPTGQATIFQLPNLSK